MISLDWTIWLGAFLIIGHSMVAIHESYLSRWAEYAYLAAGIGISMERGLANYRDVAYYPFSKGEFIYIIPLILCPLLLTRYLKKYLWLARYSSAVLVGVGMGDTLRAVFEAQIVENVLATLQPIRGSPVDIFHILLGLVLASTSTWYFISTIPRLYSGTTPRMVSTIARYGMVTSFGVAFSQSVMARINTYTGAVMFLVYDWLGLGVA